VIRRVLSNALEVLGVLLLAVVVWQLTAVFWWGLLPVGLYLIFVSFNLDGAKR
jgi:hypothetical protein